MVTCKKISRELFNNETLLITLVYMPRTTDWIKLVKPTLGIQ